MRFVQAKYVKVYIELSEPPWGGGVGGRCMPEKFKDIGPKKVSPVARVQVFGFGAEPIAFSSPPPKLRWKPI